MKKNFKIAALLAAALFVVSSCTKEDAIDNSGGGNIPSRDVSFSASAQNTRISTTENEEGISLAWEADDVLGVWYSKGGAPLANVDIQSELGTFKTPGDGVFSGKIPANVELADQLRFVYPAGRIITEKDGDVVTKRTVRVALANFKYDANIPKYFVYAISDTKDIATFASANENLDYLTGFLRIPMKFDMSGGDYAGYSLTNISIASKNGSIMTTADVKFDFDAAADGELGMSGFENVKYGAMNISVENLLIESSDATYYVRVPVLPVTFTDDVLTCKFTLSRADSDDIIITKIKNISGSVDFARGKRNHINFIAGEDVIKFAEKDVEVKVVDVSSPALTDAEVKAGVTIAQGTLEAALITAFGDAYTNALTAPIAAVKITGIMNAADFLALKNRFVSIDLSEVTGLNGKAHSHTTGTNNQVKANCIPYRAFANDITLKEIILTKADNSSGFKNFGNEAFMGTSLSRVTIPMGNASTYYGNRLFYGCDELTEIVMSTEIAIKTNAITNETFPAQFLKGTGAYSIVIPSNANMTQSPYLELASYYNYKQ